MSIEVACPHCFREYQVQEDKAGKKFLCKTCDGVVSIPLVNDMGPEEKEDDWDESLTRRQKSRRRRAGRRRGGSTGAVVVGVSMMCLSGLALALWLFSGLLFVLNGPDPNHLPPPGPDRTGAIVGFYLGGVGMLLLLASYQAAILYGAWNLLALRSRTWAMVACAFCCIPLCTPLVIVGMPFGIVGAILTYQLGENDRFES